MVAVALAPPTLPLDFLRAGETGRITGLDGPAAAVNRLAELGLREGQPVRMLRPGPPYLVQLGETRLCLRPEADVVVLVELDG